MNIQKSITPPSAGSSTAEQLSFQIDDGGAIPTSALQLRKNRYQYARSIGFTHKESKSAQYFDEQKILLLKKTILEWIPEC